MLLVAFLKDYSCGKSWEYDVCPLMEDDWEAALHAILLSFLNISQRLIQLKSLLQHHYTLNFLKFAQ